MTDTSEKTATRASCEHGCAECAEVIMHTEAEHQRYRLEARVRELEAVLREIQRPRFGCEASDSPEEMVAYWSSLAREYRSMATKALEAKP